MSDGTRYRGTFTTTADQPLRIYDSTAKEYRDVPLGVVKTLEGHVVWERMEREWKFKATGSDEKEYTGQSYPARETEYTMTLANDQKITGAIDVPLYLERAEGEKLFVIHKRDRGSVGQTLKDLPYVERVEFE